jgi:hypothetical protein
MDAWIWDDYVKLAKHDDADSVIAQISRPFSAPTSPPHHRPQPDEGQPEITPLKYC